MSEIEPREEDVAAAEVESVYRDLAGRAFERACTLQTGCCRFRLTGLTPYLTRGEALVAAQAVRRSGRVALRDRDDGVCPLLGEDGLCTIYSSRPFGCRTHFCRDAGGPYPRSEVLDLIRRLEAIDAKLDGSGAEPLPSAVARELRALADRPRRRRHRR